MSGTLPRRALVAGGAAFAALPLVARAQSWPSQPIRLVVPYAPGGTTDLTARLVAAGLAARLGQPVLVDNRPGAGATLASAQVAAAVPDGLTLLMSNIASHAIAPALYRSLRYDAVRDFTHVALVVENPSVFAANSRFAPEGLPQVVELSHRTAEGIDIASSGSGSSNHLLIVQFAEATGARVHHIPYRGAGPAMTDVIAGVVPMMSDSLPSAVGHIRAGSVRAVAMSSTKRHPAFPEVPTFREQGIDLVSTSWFGISGPAGLPPAIVERLAMAVASVLAEPATAARFAELGGTVRMMSPGAYNEFVMAEVARWAPIVAASGAQVD
ncbi:tripartite tricarboxylate transporter substrate binding protein [Belnapia sp. T6]|uniref:Tripartite tricarboxylate transporter substrate binding protein n=1 Tax=Belnapia mucosa TaxID=2804532 RepID=A0ABS1UZX5_9PROT|nr:tripartite tricarboxylate transporter substrate-binding protein [Belnapia mucosa]MBL6454386.1 tripartite tricarboxylate transporter substrate binding protein [Belnapia mucosa]